MSGINFITIQNNNILKNNVELTNNKNNVSTSFFKNVQSLKSISTKKNNTEAKGLSLYSDMGLDIQAPISVDKFKNNEVFYSSESANNRSSNKALITLLSDDDMNVVAKQLEDMSIDEFKNFFIG